MGTWGSGLWDNDSSLDRIGGLIAVKAGKDLHSILASWGLKLWFGRCEPKEFARAVEKKASEVTKLPKPLFNQLAEIAQRPESFNNKRSRKPEHDAVLGGYCDGFRIDPLFALPEVKTIVATVGERCAARLDQVLTGSRRVSLYEDQLTELGVLLELTNIGLFQDAARVARWKQGFAEMNALTTEERNFWDEYSPKVENVFSLLTR
jgi:hypothetical protein